MELNSAVIKAIGKKKITPKIKYQVMELIPHGRRGCTGIQEEHKNDDP